MKERCSRKERRKRRRERPLVDSLRESCSGFCCFVLLVFLPLHVSTHSGSIASRSIYIKHSSQKVESPSPTIMARGRGRGRGGARGKGKGGGRSRDDDKSKKNASWVESAAELTNLKL